MTERLLLKILKIFSFYGDLRDICMLTNLTNERNHKLKPLFDKIRIEESHQYCQLSGLDKENIWPIARLQGEELDVFLGHHQALCAFSSQLFSDISSDFSDGNDLFAISDAGARLINLHSCPEILAASDEIGLGSGVLLSESNCGTNAIALALRYLEPMITIGSQHYCRIMHSWGAVAMPIFNTARQPIACLAILNCSEISLGEKLLLTKLTVKELERFFKGQAACQQPSSTPRLRARDKLSVTPVPLKVNLTSRQHQVLKLFASGMSYKQIAREIGINSFKTVEEHLDAVREKLHVSHRRECIQKAISLGLI